jgi:hypothetical protein
MLKRRLRQGCMVGTKRQLRWAMGALRRSIRIGHCEEALGTFVADSPHSAHLSSLVAKAARQTLFPFKNIC